jgi:hypothetical protein
MRGFLVQEELKRSVVYVEGKGKVVPVLLTKHHDMKAYWGVEVQLHAFLTLALDEGEWSSSQAGCFNSRGNCPRYPLDRRLGGSQSRSGRAG